LRLVAEPPAKPAASPAWPLWNDVAKALDGSVIGELAWTIKDA